MKTILDSLKMIERAYLEYVKRNQSPRSSEPENNVISILPFLEARKLKTLLPQAQSHEEQKKDQ
jgi:hypothetical protein